MTSEYSSCSNRSASSGMSSSGNLSQYAIASSARGKKRVVERLHLVHRARHAACANRSRSVGRHHVAANGSRSANSVGQQRVAHRPSHLRRLALVVVDPVGGHLVQVPAEDLLVVERERGRRRATRASICVASSVLPSCSAVLLERHRGHLLREALARRSSAGRSTGSLRTRACCTTSASSGT